MQLTSFGSAAPGFPVVGAAVAGPRVHLVSRNLAPTRVALVERPAGRVAGEWAVPTGDGAWGVAAIPGGVVLGQFGARGQDNVYRVREEVRALAALDVDYTWDLAVERPGRLVGVTGPPGLYRVDAASGEVTTEPLPVEGVRLTRSVTATAAGVVIGGAGTDGALLALLDGRDSRDLLPAGLAGHHDVYALAAAGGRVAVGTTGPDRRDPAVGLVDLADGTAVTVTLPGETLVDQLCVHRGTVYASVRPSGAVLAWTPGTPPRRLAVPVPGAETRALALADDRLVGVSTTSEIFTVHPDDGEATVLDPREHGLGRHPERPQSVGAGGGAVVVGGSFTVHVHRPAAGAHRDEFVPGEPKDIAVVGSTAYLGVYPVAEVWALPLEAGAPRLLARLPRAQLRPLSLAWDAAGGRLLVTTTDDAGRGMLHLVDPDGGTATSLHDPLVAGEIAYGMAAAGGLAYLGGSGGSPSLGAFDLAERRLRWRTDGVVPDPGFVVGVAPVGGRVCCLSSRGWLAAVDRADGRLLAQHRIDDTGGRLRAVGGRLWAVTSRAAFAIDPDSLAVRAEVRLDPEVFNYPPLATDETGALWTIRGRDLVRIEG